METHKIARETQEKFYSQKKEVYIKNWSTVKNITSNTALKRYTGRACFH
jgi:hypothetical protein